MLLTLYSSLLYAIYGIQYILALTLVTVSAFQLARMRSTYCILAKEAFGARAEIYKRWCNMKLNL